jgi:hypothetical protein
MIFNMSPSPPVGSPLSVRAPLEPIKGRVRTVEKKAEKFTHTLPSSRDTQTHKQYNTQWS